MAPDFAPCTSVGALVFVAPAYVHAVREVVGLGLGKYAQPDPDAVRELGAEITTVDSDAYMMRDPREMSRACAPGGACVYYSAQVDRNGSRFVAWGRPELREGSVAVNLTVSVRAVSKTAEAQAIRATWVRIDQQGDLIPLARFLPIK